MHHRQQHEQMLRAGVSLRYEADPVTRVEMALRAMAAYRRAEADAMERMAELLRTETERRTLDQRRR